MRQYESRKQFFGDGHGLTDFHVEVAVLAPNFLISILVVYHRLNAFVVRSNVCGGPLQQTRRVFGRGIDYCKKKEPLSVDIFCDPHLCL